MFLFLDSTIIYKEERASYLYRIEKKNCRSKKHVSITSREGGRREKRERTYLKKEEKKRRKKRRARYLYKLDEIRTYESRSVPLTREREYLYCKF